MRISEVPDSLIKEHCGISGSDSDALIGVYRQAAVSEICGYTGLTYDELDEYEDITYAFLALVCEMFSTREMTVDVNTLNPMAEQILDSHRRNLL